jgi:polar amino acid transport system substrate-binding protein
MMRTILRLLAWMTLLAAPCAPAAAQGALHIAYTEFPLFHCRDAQGNMSGLLYDIVTEAVQKRLGVPVAWEPGPWARCQERVQRGQADAMLTVPTPERARYTVTHDEPLYRKERTLFTYAGHPRMDQILALRDARGIRDAGFTVITYVGNGWSRTHLAGAGIEVLEAPSLEGVWRMLAARRGDLVVEWPPAARETMGSLLPGGEVVQTPVVLESVPFHLLVAKQSPLAGFLPQLSAVLRAMRADGSMERILSAYR